MVALLSSKPATYFPRWFVTTWMDGHLGLHARRDPPVPRAQLPDRRAVRRRRAVAQPRHQHRLPRRQRRAGAGGGAAGGGLGLGRRPWRRWSSRCCRCRPNRWPGSPAASTRCRRASSSPRSCSTSAGGRRAAPRRLRWCGGLVRGGPASKQNTVVLAPVPGGVRRRGAARVVTPRRGRGCARTCRSRADRSPTWDCATPVR